MIEVDGRLEVVRESLGFGQYVASVRSLRFGVPIRLSEGRVQIRDLHGNLAWWRVIKELGNTWSAVSLGYLSFPISNLSRSGRGRPRLLCDDPSLYPSSAANPRARTRAGREISSRLVSSCAATFPEGGTWKRAHLVHSCMSSVCRPRPIKPATRGPRRPLGASTSRTWHADRGRHRSRGRAQRTTHPFGTPTRLQ